MPQCDRAFSRLARSRQTRMRVVTGGMASLSPPSAPSRLLIPSLSAANFAIGMGGFVVIGILAPIRDDFGLSSADAGWIMTAYAIAYAIGSPLGVALTGSVGRRTVLATGLSIFTFAMILAALAPGLEVLIASRVLAALGAGLVTPVAAGVAAAASPPEKRGKALAAAFFGLTLAQVLGVPAGAWLGYTFGWPFVFVATGVLALVALAGILALVPRGMPFQVNSLTTLGQALRDGQTMLAVLFTVFIMGAIYVFYTYTAPVMEARMGFERDGISLYLLMFGCGAVAGNLLGGWLTDRIGAFNTLLFVAVAQTLLMPVFSFLPLPTVVVYGHAFLWSVCGWSFAASQQSRLVSLGPERASVMLALNAAAIYVGVSFGSLVGGVALKTYGMDALGVTGAGIAVLAVLALFASRKGGR